MNSLLLLVKNKNLVIPSSRTSFPHPQSLFSLSHPWYPIVGDIESLQTTSPSEIQYKLTSRNNKMRFAFAAAALGLTTCVGAAPADLSGSKWTYDMHEGIDKYDP